MYNYMKYNKLCVTKDTKYMQHKKCVVIGKANILGYNYTHNNTRNMGNNVFLVSDSNMLISYTMDTWQKTWT